MRLGGLVDRSGKVRKISFPPRLDPRTVQPEASRCTDCDIPADIYLHENLNHILISVTQETFWEILQWEIPYKLYVFQFEAGFLIY